ncbi:hypothetical protein [Streptomyces sp. BE303]|uniref:hypothetical protein n=1 Tax=Streptomyces sp. BE303 TaxID=3002528 RepID=UPI002E7888CF|nr:hypothetical protein [Streptomyces sp. BE303]MED7948800.1 hypothetical protein [Streptomyces sp. BE303]
MDGESRPCAVAEGGVGRAVEQRRDPAVPVRRLFQEIKELSYSAGLNLLNRYLIRGRADGDRPVIGPRRLAGLMLTRPDRRRDKETDVLQAFTTAWPARAPARTGHGLPDRAESAVRAGACVPRGRRTW